jgi:hypothetical protein
VLIPNDGRYPTKFSQAASDTPLVIPSSTSTFARRRSSKAPRAFSHHRSPSGTSRHPPRRKDAKGFKLVPPLVVFKRDFTCSQCGGGCSCEYELEYELGAESEGRPASNCGTEAVGSDDDGGAEYPFKANTRAGGTVILPCLKHSCEIEMQWSFTPSSASRFSS